MGTLCKRSCRDAIESLAVARLAIDCPWVFEVYRIRIFRAPMLLTEITIMHERTHSNVMELNVRYNNCARSDCLIQYVSHKDDLV